MTNNQADTLSRDEVFLLYGRPLTAPCRTMGGISLSIGVFDRSSSSSQDWCETVSSRPVSGSCCNGGYLSGSICDELNELRVIA